MNSFVNTLGVFIIILLPCSNTFGQSTDTLKYKFEFQIGVQRKRGAVDQTTFKVASNNELENKKLIFTNLSHYTYNKVNGVNIANDLDFRTYAMLKLNSTTKLLPIIAHNYIKNVLYRITSSNRVLAGVRIIPVKQHRDFSFYVGTGYEFSNYNSEIFIESPIVSSQRNFALGFLRISGKHKLGKNKILIDYNFFSVQSFEEAKDYSFWLASGVHLPLNKKLSIGVSYDFRFRNVHLEEIPDYNDLLLFNIKYNHSN